MSRVISFSLAVCALLCLSGVNIAQAQLYWRADLGYSFAGDASIRDKDLATLVYICGDPLCNTAGELDDLGSSPVLSAGVGWRYNPNLRADATLAYRGSYELNDDDAAPSTYKADVSSWNLMANGYWDLNLLWGKPYVGAGLGWASNKVNDIVNNGGAFGPTDYTTLPGKTTSGVAWALMAGLSMPLNPTMTLDIGYRYTDLGDIEFGSGTAIFTSPAFGTSPFFYPGASGKLTAHEISVGLRF